MPSPPVVKLCNTLFDDCLARRVAIVEFVGAGSLPVVNQYVEGTWQPYMQYPAPLFAEVAHHLRRLAGLAEEQAEAAGVIHVQHAGRDVEIALTANRSGGGTEILTLHFPERQPRGVPPNSRLAEVRVR